MMTKDRHNEWEYPTGWFDWPKPISLEIGMWDEWEKDLKEKYPIRYFFYESLPEFWSYHIYRRARDIKWWFLHRFHPSHRYHVIKTSLEPGYWDPDTRMFTAAFDLLSEFVEHERGPNQHVDWDAEEPHRSAWKEMNELYEWWKDRPNREDRWEKENPEPPIDDDLKDGFFKRFQQQHRDRPCVIAYGEWAMRHHKQSDEWDQEDDDMFIRLVKIRRFMWY